MSVLSLCHHIGKKKNQKQQSLFLFLYLSTHSHIFPIKTEHTEY